MIKALKKTALVSTLTLFSRLLGLARDTLIAIYFGVSFQSDAFFIAFRPFDMARKLFSEGILNISFIPIFSKTISCHDLSLTLEFGGLTFNEARITGNDLPLLADDRKP